MAKEFFTIPPQNLGHFFSKHGKGEVQKISETLTESDGPIEGLRMRYEEDPQSRIPRKLVFLNRDQAVIGQFKVENVPDKENKVVFIPGNYHASSCMNSLATVISMIKGISA